MKTCTRCKQQKDESEFSIDRRSRDGLQYNCKECNKIDTQKVKEKRRKARELRLQSEKEKTTKVCSKCGIEKDKSEFHKHDGGKSGLRAFCKKCRSRSKRPEFLYEILPDNTRRCKICYEIKEISKFRPKKRVCFECEKEYSRKYYHSHKEHASEVNKQYIQKHKERIDRLRREYMCIFRKTPAGRLRDKLRRERRRKLGWEPINKWFEGSEGHHLRFTGERDDKIGVYIPRDLHQSIKHNGNTGKNLIYANKVFLEWYLNNTPADERDNKAVKLYWNYCVLAEPEKI